MGIHVRSFLNKARGMETDGYSGMPKFWPIALLSVLNSKYKIRVQMEQERDRASLSTSTRVALLTIVETTDLRSGVHAQAERHSSNHGCIRLHQGKSSSSTLSPSGGLTIAE